MKRFAIACLVLCLSSTMVAGANAKKKTKKVTRAVTGTYEASIATSPGVGPFWVGSPIGNISAADFTRGMDERYVMVKIEDAQGMPIAGTIGADLDGTPTTLETIADFCSETETPVELPAEAATVRVLAKSGQCGGEVGIATHGEITVTFSNVP